MATPFQPRDCWPAGVHKNSPTPVKTKMQALGASMEPEFDLHGRGRLSVADGSSFEMVHINLSVIAIDASVNIWLL